MVATILHRWSEQESADVKRVGITYCDLRSVRGHWIKLGNTWHETICGDHSSVVKYLTRSC